MSLRALCRLSDCTALTHSRRKLSETWIRSNYRGSVFLHYQNVTSIYDRSPKTWRRSIKTKVSIGSRDLPQGTVPLEPLELDEDEPSYPTVLQQAKNNMRKFGNCVLLTRVGSFYELYFEHAERFGPQLGLKVAQKKTNAGPVAMAGFPFFQLDRFLKILVQDLHLHVAISEEYPVAASNRVKAGGLQFDRKVARIVTPGTLIDERFMDPFQHNFLLAVFVDPTTKSLDSTGEAAPGTEDLSAQSRASVGLAWLDLSTGDFFTEKTDLASLSSAIARIGPREILLNREVAASIRPGLPVVLQDYQDIITYRAIDERASEISDWNQRLDSPVTNHDLSHFGEDEIAAGNLLLGYVTLQLQGIQIKLRPPVRRDGGDTMLIDKHSLRSLEIRATLRDGNFRGSLLHSMRRTVTSGGARLLSHWLSAPSTALSVITSRQDLVSHFVRHSDLKDEITHALLQTFDAHRLLQKFSLGRGDPDDLIALCKSIQATTAIRDLLVSNQDSNQTNQLKGEYSISTRQGSNPSLDSIIHRFKMENPMALAKHIAEALDEEGISEKHRLDDTHESDKLFTGRDADNCTSLPQESQEKGVKRLAGSSKKTSTTKLMDSDPEEMWVMRKSASPALQELHNDLSSLNKEKTGLEMRLKEELSAMTLTLRWTPGLGHICHVKGKDTRSSVSALSNVRSVSSSRSTRSFYVTEWTELGNRIDKAKLRITAEEQRVFHELRDEVIANLTELRANAGVLDELDVTCSFATLAQERDFVRPKMNLSSTHKVIGGRHPMVERGLQESGRSFISNDCNVGEEERIWLITGPNMAGKSTFLRQNALISILAQVGSFVPADYAEMGIVDRMFSRIGSADSLFNDQSTFMVEMVETAAILREATPRSFVIMDEVGRGTTPRDGIAVGYACLDYLYHVNKCRTLFATHFHSLADMSKDMKHLACYCTDVAEDANGSFTYIHRLTKGVNRQSHALKVARLAGLPEAAVRVAHDALNKLQPT
ncbi:MAG: DNA mismatch repair ATPase msh1 [Piccolia ochrophora]|nr:MAG: DNA mismatch repair ATPase msh1 [Piccolia ochrophora]